MSLVEPGQDPNNLNMQPVETTPELNVDLANPGQANAYLNPQIPSSDTIMAPNSQPAPAPVPQPQPPVTEQPLQSNIPPTMPSSAEPPKPQIAWDRVAMVGAGVIIIAALGAFLLLGNKKPAAQTPTPTPQGTTEETAKELTASKLEQKSAESTLISSGGSYNQNKITLEFDILNASGTDVIPEVEVQPMGTAFTGTPTSKGQAATPKTASLTGDTAPAAEASGNTSSDTSVSSTDSANTSVASDAASGGTASAIDTPTTGATTTLRAVVVVTGLTDGAYHWQARATQSGKSGDWVPYGTDVSAADFTIDTVAPTAPTLANIDSAAVASGQTVTTTSNRPTFTGKADPSSTVSIEVKPEGIKLSAVADTSGNWSVTSGTDIPNGSHSVVASGSDAAGNTATTTVALGINTTAASSPTVAATTPESNLAQTGEPTGPITLVALAALIICASSLIVINRYADR